MRDEEIFEIPDGWRRLVHPRRGGMAPIPPEPITAGAAAALASTCEDKQAEFELILNHPDTAPELAALARSDDHTVEPVGVRFTLANHILGGRNMPAYVAGAVDELGLATVVDAIVYGTALAVAPPARPTPGSAWYALFRISTETESEYHLWAAGAFDLRARLSAAPDDVYREAVDRLDRYRHGSVRQRIMTSYLISDRPDWVAADLDAAAELYQLGGIGKLLMYSATSVDTLARFSADFPVDVVTAYDAVGNDAAEVLLRWLHTWLGAELRSYVLDVLSRIPTDAAFAGLLRRIDEPGFAHAVHLAAQRFPRRAMRLLAACQDDDAAADELRAHALANPELSGAAEILARQRPDADESAVPRLLAEPPWTRPAPPRITIAPAPFATEATIEWLDDEERESWSYNAPWSMSDDHAAQYDDGHRLDGRRDGWTDAQFFLCAPANLVRPRLAHWRAETGNFYLQNPQSLVAKYELDALTPVLRLARHKPVVGAPLLLPYLSADVAELMAGWLARSRQFRPIAEQWFTRHGAQAAALLIPLALGAPPATSRPATLALMRLDGDLVRAAARDLECSSEVDMLLERDPLDLIPAKVPGVPKWLNPQLLPQILLADGIHALPVKATSALIRMIAMSDLDAPYDGLRAVVAECQPQSAAAFAWALFRRWEVAERPAKDVWAMNALAYFGDDSVAERLAPMVRRWPSEGAAPRAKRGVDVLAAIGTDTALGHLSALARNAKSTPLRAHAGARLDQLAHDRGLLPEQLDDLLAPDLGLSGDPIAYRDATYVPELSAKLELVLHDEANNELAALPTARDDDEKAIAAAWRSRRKKAKPLITDQVRRFEEALIVQRRWSGTEFATAIAGHPLLGRLARRLVWAADERTAVLDRLGDLVDVDRTILDTRWVRIAHPAADDLAPWRSWLANGVVQPFPQLERDGYVDVDPSTLWGRTTTAASLYRLISRGWHWGPTGRAARRERLLRPFGSAGQAILMIEPGVTATLSAAGEPDQTITELTLESPTHGELAVFSDLPRVTRSELIRDLRSLAPVAASH